MTTSPETAPFAPGDRVRWHNPPRMEGTVLKNNGGRCKVQWDTGEVRRDDPDKLRFASEEILPFPFPTTPPVHAVVLTTSHAGFSTSIGAAPVVTRNSSDSEAAPAAEVRETRGRPGPWTSHRTRNPCGPGDEWQIHWSPDGECVAEVVHGEADARLIAAAPDLAACCEAMLALLMSGTLLNSDTSVTREQFVKIATMRVLLHAGIDFGPRRDPFAALDALAAARATQQGAGDVG